MTHTQYDTLAQAIRQELARARVPAYLVPHESGWKPVPGWQEAIPPLEAILVSLQSQFPDVPASILAHELSKATL